ncbi:MAG: TonB-dependent receptor [Planctomycetes bacterium]|jgi:outer membrane receptor protein involved in Fe transport|nr:TonB-dependent receptor [Planctomycetota bacterium]MCL4730312.1 TonB-dependent receptor [Planctomycetota bacterium]
MRLALPAVLCLFVSTLYAQDPAAPAPGRADPQPKETANEGSTDVKVVTARGSAQELMDVPDAVTVLTRRQIQERMFGQLPDVMDGSTGVFLQHTAGGQGSPFLRGRTGKEIVMLVNGVRFNTSTFRGGPNQYYASIDPGMVERIEIVRGPASVLYGSDALGGVINVILAQPRFTEFDYGFGARGRYESASARKQGGAFGEVHTTMFSGMVNATYADVDELVGGNSIGRQPFTSYEEWGFGAVFGVRLDRHTLSVTWSHFQQQDVNRTDAVSGIMPNQKVLPAPGVGTDLRRLFTLQMDDMAILNWTWEGRDLLEELALNLWYHRQQEDLQRIRRSSPNRLEEMAFNNHSLGIKTQAVLDFHALARLTLGAEAIHDMVSTRSVDINRTTKSHTNHDNREQYPDWCSYTSFGVYAQNETSLADDRLQFRYGVRWSMYRALADVDRRFPQFDGVNDVYTDLTGAVAVVGRPMDELALTLNLARGFRAPNTDDLSAVRAFGGGQQFPNPDIDPEVQYSVDLGARLVIPTADRKAHAPYEMTAHVVGFFNYLEDLLINQPVTISGVNGVAPKNAGRGRIFGFEAEAGFYLSGALGWLGLPSDRVFFEGDALGVFANVTWTRGDDLKNDTPIHRIPPLFAEVRVRYEALHGEVYLEPYVTIVGRQDQYAPNVKTDSRFTPGDAPGYVLFNLRAGWAPSRHVRFNMGVQNIGNRSYHPMGSGTYGPGTNVMLSGELRW